VNDNQLNMPADGTAKPCPTTTCGGTFTFQRKTPVPGTGGINIKTGMGAIEPEYIPGWCCSTCNRIEWLTKAW
jgi:hypothetical protein